MTALNPRQPFQPQPPDIAGVTTWVHIGDLHMTQAAEQNDIDLQAIVKKLNRSFAGSTSFVYLPGDVADDGSRDAYKVVRRSIDELQVPWCAIIGDHDVHERSFANFLEAVADRTHYAFTVGGARFLAMNAFDIPEPPSFTVSAAQLRWAEDELRKATAEDQGKVILFHCYPSDLKSGGEELSRLIHEYNVRLVDMGHTHYNEIANDGNTVYMATRSTGQIEEGPVGFSVTNLDGANVSWRFVEPDDPVTVIITTPEDERLTPDGASAHESHVIVRAKVWSDATITSVRAELGRTAKKLTRISGSQVWEGTVEDEAEADELRVVACTANGTTAHDTIRIRRGAATQKERHPRDQDNHIGAWEEHSLLGTQLGPNKNGKKW